MGNSRRKLAIDGTVKNKISILVSWDKGKTNRTPTIPRNSFEVDLMMKNYNLYSNKRVKDKNKYMLRSISLRMGRK